MARSVRSWVSSPLTAFSSKLENNHNIQNICTNKNVQNKIHMLLSHMDQKHFLSLCKHLPWGQFHMRQPMKLSLHDAPLLPRFSVQHQKDDGVCGAWTFLSAFCDLTHGSLLGNVLPGQPKATIICKEGTARYGALEHYLAAEDGYNIQAGEHMGTCQSSPPSPAVISKYFPDSFTFNQIPGVTLTRKKCVFYVKKEQATQIWKCRAFTVRKKQWPHTSKCV